MLEISCPSGLRGTLRGMKMKDEKVLVDKKLVRSARSLTALLESCWLETLDPGPYAVEGKFDWDKALTADRTYALIQLRIASYGADYEFDVTCQNDSCGRKYGWGLDLNDMDVAQVSAEAKQYVQTQKPVALTLATGTVVQCRPLTGEDERFLATKGADDQSMVLAHHLARRIVEIRGKKKWRDVVSEIEDLEVREADELWDLTDEYEGGVETMIDTVCPSCDNEQRVLLPFEASFFSSRKRFAGSRTKRSGSN